MVMLSVMSTTNKSICDGVEAECLTLQSQQQTCVTSFSGVLWKLPRFESLLLLLLLFSFCHFLVRSSFFLKIVKIKLQHLQSQLKASMQCTLGEHMDIWDLLTQCINFYSHSLIFPVILPSLIVYNLFIWWYRWVSGEKYYHFLYFAFSVTQTVQKLQVFCFFWSLNGFRE